MAAETVDADYSDRSTKSAILGLADYLTRICLDAPFRSPEWLPRLLIRIARTQRQEASEPFLPKTVFQTKAAVGPHRT